ncbi:MAG: hypothetical protein PHT33_10850, partial [bacterium]|nr:hypothetical protein [bacterium]
PGKKGQGGAAVQGGSLATGTGRSYSRYAELTNPNVITYRRRYGTTDYLFAINDSRECGTYVGQYGMVLEDGLPSKTELLVSGKKRYIYDLVSGQRVAVPDAAAGKLCIPVQLGPCDGRILMITEREIHGVKVSLPERASTGQGVDCRIAVVDDAGRPVDAVVPVCVDIFDPEGARMEFSGYYGAVNGQLAIRMDLAQNDRTGLWRVRVQEMASGKTTDGYLRVSKEPGSAG